MTTCMLMFLETGWASKDFLTFVMAYAAFYGGLGQLLAGILEVRSRVQGTQLRITITPNNQGP